MYFVFHKKGRPHRWTSVKLMASVKVFWVVQDWPLVVWCFRSVRDGGTKFRIGLRNSITQDRVVFPGVM